MSIKCARIQVEAGEKWFRVALQHHDAIATDSNLGEEGREIKGETKNWSRLRTQATGRPYITEIMALSCAWTYNSEQLTVTDSIDNELEFPIV